MKKKPHKSSAPETQIVMAGRAPHLYGGVVNMPVHRGSTLVQPTLADLRATSGTPFSYGRRGTPSTLALETALAEIEGAALCRLTPSGLSAIAVALMACVQAGDHILVSQSVYEPTRTLCDTLLTQLGVETEYYPPRIGADIATLIRKPTRAIFLESPGSQTFEVQDVPAICAVARQHKITTILDNTWAGLLYFNPFKHGADIAVSALTKYVGGHADLLLGAVSCTKAYHEAVYAAHGALGQCAGPDDVMLAARGLRTLATRLERHMQSALTIANWLESLPFIRKVLYPALPSSEDHALWARDFSGASGLFGFITEPISEKRLAAMLDNMELFPMGYSWGGYESLLIPTDAARERAGAGNGRLMRIHVGLENPDDLRQDLTAGFKRAGFKL